MLGLEKAKPHMAQILYQIIHGQVNPDHTADKEHKGRRAALAVAIIFTAKSAKGRESGGFYNHKVTQKNQYWLWVL